LIPQGKVDCRSIKDVKADELEGFTQWHFFAGTGLWCHALQLAGIDGEPGICTGSPPCQDNSLARAIHGERLGLRGVRSGLAFSWLDLVGAVLPRLVLFENVPGIKRWQAEVTSRLEGLGYRVFVRDLSSASIGALDSRRRVWIAADRDGAGLEIARTAGPSQIECDSWAAAPGDIWQEDHPATGGLDDGNATRMATIRAIGNAINPFVAATFIRAYMDSLIERSEA
jgi:site-specific DNA-cytosine methylase